MGNNYQKQPNQKPNEQNILCSGCSLWRITIYGQSSSLLCLGGPARSDYGGQDGPSRTQL